MYLYIPTLGRYNQIIIYTNKKNHALRFFCEFINEVIKNAHVIYFNIAIMGECIFVVHMTSAERVYIIM